MSKFVIIFIIIIILAVSGKVSYNIYKKKKKEK